MFPVGAVRLPKFRMHPVSSGPGIVIGVTHPQTCLTLTGRIRAFRQAGFAVTLVCSPGPLAQRLAQEEGARLVEIPIERVAAPWPDLRALLSLVLLLSRLKPEIAEFSTPKAGLLGTLAAWLCRVPVRVYMVRGLKLETSRGVRRFLLMCSERLCAACAHVVLCNSKSLFSAILELGIAPASKLLLYGNGSSNGVNLSRFQPSEARRQLISGLVKPPVIGFVGRLTRDKGIPVLIDAFTEIQREFPSAKLLLVGWFDRSQDALSADEQSWLAEHSQIFMTGFVPDAAPYYHAMDLLVLPSWREGFPNVVLEAAASGVPVVTTLATGCRDSVVPGTTGLLVPPGDSHSLANALRTLLLQPDLRESMGRAARNWVCENFSDQKVLSHTVCHYQALLRAALETRQLDEPLSWAGKKTSMREAFDTE